jgi:hypothetical protein
MSSPLPRQAPAGLSAPNSPGVAVPGFPPVFHVQEILRSVRGRPIEFYLFPSRLCVHVNHNRKLQYANSEKVILE